MKMEGYTTHPMKEGNSSNEIVLNQQTGKVESVSTKRIFGNINIGVDGSITYGSNIISIGSDAYDNLIIDISVPWFGDISNGVTMTFSKEPWSSLLNCFGSPDYHFTPSAPTYLIPAFSY